MTISHDLRKITALAISICAIPVFGGSSNLLKGDTSFETGYGSFENKGSIDEKCAYDGSKSLRLETAESIRIPNVFKLQPGKAYTFSAYMKSDSLGAKSTLMAYRSNWKGQNISKVFNLTSKWKRYVLEIPEQKAGDWNNVWLYVTPDNGIINVDACQFEEGSLSYYHSS